MGLVEPIDLEFPVLCLSHDTSIVVARDADEMKRCNALAFWGNNYFRDLRVVDSNGIAYTVIDAEPDTAYSRVARLFMRLTNRAVRVRLRLRPDGSPSLAIAKQLASEWLDRAPYFWEASGELSEWKARVMACSTMGELINVFE